MKRKSELLNLLNKYNNDVYNVYTHILSIIIIYAVQTVLQK